MIVTLQTAGLQTLAQVRAFVEGNEPVSFTLTDRTAAHQRLHYVEAGQGPLVVSLHGFPEFWYSWRYQIPALIEAGFRVIALDQRGYNISDKPASVAHYRIEPLVDDVVGVIRAAGERDAVVVGHDWGGAIAWMVAMNHPAAVRQLVVMNAPHPRRVFEEFRTAANCESPGTCSSFNCLGSRNGCYNGQITTGSNSC